MRKLFTLLIGLNMAVFLWYFALPFAGIDAGRPGSDVAFPWRSKSKGDESAAAARLAEGGDPAEERSDPKCVTVGPFANRAAASAFMERLLAWDLKSSLQQVSEAAGAGLWVQLGVGEELKLAPAAWEKLVHQEFRLEQQQNFCSTVASQ